MVIEPWRSYAWSLPFTTLKSPENIITGPMSAFRNPLILLLLVILGSGFALSSLSSWVRALHLLIAVVLFGGIVGVRLGSGALPVAIRDVSIVLPLYAAFLTTRSGIDALARVPGEVALCFIAVVGWLAICTLNPQDVSGPQLLIGLKVWAYYVPFVVVGIGLVRRSDAMFKTLRVLLVLGTVTCGVGVLQALLVRVIGYEPAIALFFGKAAFAVTQGFSSYQEGGGVYRIPATFSFGAQYVEFLFLYLTAAIMVANTDPDSRYRQLGQVAVYLALFAGVVSGTKGALILFPIFFGALFMCGLVKSRLVVAAPVAALIGGVALVAIGVDVAGLFSFGTKTTQHYLSGFVLEQIGDALGHGVFGEGIGSSTGAVRYVAVGGGGVVQLGFESYYAKIAAELGAGGLAIFGMFFLVIAAKAVLIVLRYRWTAGNALTAPLAIYIVFNLVYSAKGFVLDTDPGNIFFWLALGLLFGLDLELRSTRAVDEGIIPVDPPLPMAGAAQRQATAGS
jgi:hypothetical protein